MIDYIVPPGQPSKVRGHNDVCIVAEAFTKGFASRILCFAVLLVTICPSCAAPLFELRFPEMLGDAVLDYIANTYLYHYLPTASPGDLTLWRQRFSRRSTQATIAMHFGLHKVLCYESPTLFRVCACVPYADLRKAVGWVGRVLH